MKNFLLFIGFIFLITLTILIIHDQKNANYGFFGLEGDSNGNFLGEIIFVKKAKIEDLEVGDFVVRNDLGGLVVHPIVEIIKSNGEILAFKTKGLNNKTEDKLLFKKNIVGRAFKVLPNGEIEKDTRFP